MIFRLASAIQLIPWKIVGLMAAGGVVTLFYFGNYVGKVEQIDPRLQQMADIVVERAIDALPQPEITGRMMVLPFAQDHTRYLRDRFMQQIAASGKYPVVNLGKLGNELRDAGIDLPMPETLVSAQRMASAIPGEYLLWGEIKRWRLPATTSSATEPDLIVELYLLDPKQEQPIWQQQYQYPDQQMDTLTKPLPVTKTDPLEALLWRVAAWVVVAPLLPLLLLPLVRTLLQQQRNSTNLMLLISLSGLGTGLAWLLFSPWLVGPWLPVALLGATVVTLWSHYKLLEWIEAKS